MGNPTLDQIKFGNNIVKLVEESVKFVGWPQSAQAAMIANIKASYEFGKMFPTKGEVGKTFTVTPEFREAYQEWMGSLSLLAATVAHRSGVDLKMDVEGTA